MAFCCPCLKKGKGKKRQRKKSKATEIPDWPIEQTQTLSKPRKNIDVKWTHLVPCLGGKSKAQGQVPASETAQKSETHKVPSSAIRQIDVGESKSGKGVGSGAVHVECATTVVYEGYLTKGGGIRHYLEKKLEKALVCIAERFEAIVLRYRG